MNPNTVLELAAELKILRFFPSDSASLNAVVRVLGAMCQNETRVRWLVHRMTSGLYAEWPGIGEMRACYCSRFKPNDGIEAYSSVYPDGIPLDPDLLTLEKQLKATAAKTLPAPQRQSVSTVQTPGLDLSELAQLKDLNRIGPNPRLRDIPALRPEPFRPRPGGRPITQAEIDEAMRLYREQKEKSSGSDINPTNTDGAVS
jgi:hypothetical protein